MKICTSRVVHIQTYVYSFMELLSLTQVISKYLMEVDDIELRFELATQAQIFDIGIEVSIEHHDYWSIVFTVMISSGLETDEGS